jgi:hypothetical protein
MTEVQVWEVTAIPDGKYWSLDVKGFDQPTQARSVKEIDEMVRDFISCLTDISADQVKYELTFQLPESVNEALKEAQRLREIADRARKDSAMASTRAAKILRGQGLRVRDIGAALGISFQRAQQLLNR